MVARGDQSLDLDQLLFPPGGTEGVEEEVGPSNLMTSLVLEPNC
jgi:hypothetical protein